MADTEFGSPAEVDKEASETADAILAGAPLEDEGTDDSEKMYEAAQREAEQDIEGEAPQDTSEPVEETLLAGKYKTPEDLETAYRNLESKLGELGPQAKESQELRERLARLEGRIESHPPATPSADPVQKTRDAYSAAKIRGYVAMGFNEEQAKEQADTDVMALGMFVEAEIGKRTERYDSALAQNELAQRVEAQGAELRQETDATGNPVRPDWDEVVVSDEFRAAAVSLGDDFYTRAGLELAYLRTRPLVHQQISTDTEAAVASAKAEASDSKRRASVSPAATPAAKTPKGVTAEDDEIEAIYKAASEHRKSDSVFGGQEF